MAKPMNPKIVAYMRDHGVSYSCAYERLHRKRIVTFHDADRVAALAAKLDAVEAMEWARLAAFIDGEGTIYVRRSAGSHYYPSMCISNTDPRLGLWLASIFGGGLHYRRAKQSPRHKPYSMWSVTSRHAEFILRHVRPYLILKGEQADVALAMRETVRLGRNQENQITPQEYERRDALMTEMHRLNKRGVDAG